MGFTGIVSPRNKWSEISPCKKLVTLGPPCSFSCGKTCGENLQGILGVQQSNGSIDPFHITVSLGFVFFLWFFTDSIWWDSSLNKPPFGGNIFWFLASWANLRFWGSSDATFSVERCFTRKKCLGKYGCVRGKITQQSLLLEDMVGTFKHSINVLLMVWFWCLTN